MEAGNNKEKSGSKRKTKKRSKSKSNKGSKIEDNISDSGSENSEMKEIAFVLERRNMNTSSGSIFGGFSGSSGSNGNQSYGDGGQRAGILGLGMMMIMCCVSS
jgi:hypothetical protein